MNAVRIVLLLLVASTSWAQPNKMCVFQLLDSVSLLPVADAHVVLQRSRQGTISNEQGLFKINAEKPDTLSITALGYHKLHYDFGCCSKGVGTMSYIFLVPLSYSIDSVAVVRHKTYYSFIKDATTRDIPLTQEEQRLEILTERINSVNTDSLIMPEHSRFEVPYLKLVSKTWHFGEDWYSKQRKRIRRKERKEKRMESIFAIVSAAGIERLTGLQGDQAIKFLVYCNFSSRFLEKATEYEVAKAVLDKFEEYQKFIAAQSY